MRKFMAQEPLKLVRFLKALDLKSHNPRAMRFIIHIQLSPFVTFRASLSEDKCVQSARQQRELIHEAEQQVFQPPLSKPFEMQSKKCGITLVRIKNLVEFFT